MMYRAVRIYNNYYQYNLQLYTMNFQRLITLFLLFATVHLQANASSVVDDLTVNVRVYLEGALYNSFEVSEEDGRPLMRDDLRFHPQTLSNYLPSFDIYQFPHEVTSNISVDVTSKYTHVGCGTYPQYQNITDPNSVFAVEGENAIVDWVFVELRDANDFTQVVATRSGLIQRDGDVVDLDGVSPLTFNDVVSTMYYVAVRHRNHLGAMTKFPMSVQEMETLVDFSGFSLNIYDQGNSDGMFNYSGLAMRYMNVNGQEVRTLWAGDFNADGIISYHSKENDLELLQKEVASYDINQNPMYQTEFDGAFGYLQSDYDMNGQAKFSAPNDDQNFLLVQVTLYDLNAEVLTNFVHILQQLPQEQE